MGTTRKLEVEMESEDVTEIVPSPDKIPANEELLSMGETNAS